MPSVTMKGNLKNVQLILLHHSFQVFGDRHFVDILQLKEHANSVMLNNHSVWFVSGSHPLKSELVMESRVVGDDFAGA